MDTYKSKKSGENRDFTSLKSIFLDNIAMTVLIIGAFVGELLLRILYQPPHHPPFFLLTILRIDEVILLLSFSKKLILVAQSVIEVLDHFIINSNTSPTLTERCINRIIL